MPLDPQLLEQVLGAPASTDITESPIVTALILGDPANAADLVPALGEKDTRRGRNARRVLCLFDARAVTPLLVASRGTDATTTIQAVEVMWAILVAEEAWTIREALSNNMGDIGSLLDDKRPTPDTMPDYVERDFVGRVCDLTYILLQYLVNPSFDRSTFRGLDDRGRDAEINRLKARGFGLHIA